MKRFFKESRQVWRGEMTPVEFVRQVYGEVRPEYILPAFRIFCEDAGVRRSLDASRQAPIGYISWDWWKSQFPEEIIENEEVRRVDSFAEDFAIPKL